GDEIDSGIGGRVEKHLRAGDLRTLSIERNHLKVGAVLLGAAELLGAVGNLIEAVLIGSGRCPEWLILSQRWQISIVGADGHAGERLTLGGAGMTGNREGRRPWIGFGRWRFGVGFRVPDAGVCCLVPPPRPFP